MESPRTRFWNGVEIKSSAECWEWKRCKHPRGYGRISLYGKYEIAHRTAYFLTYGFIPQGFYVLHHCDNPSCCNPDHLYAGTQQDNVNDMFARNRAKYPRREKPIKKVQIIPLDPRLATWPYAPNENLVALWNMV